MLTFKQYLAAKEKLPKGVKVDLTSLTEKDKKQFERVQQKFQYPLSKTEKPPIRCHDKPARKFRYTSPKTKEPV